MTAPTHDALVIGAGPAGSLAARQLALLGQRVLLVDRAAFPRPKVCGCCLNASALATLDAVGLGHLLAAHHAPTLDRLSLLIPGRRADVPLPPGVSLSRDIFDQALIDAALDAGVTFRDQTNARVESLPDPAAEVSQPHPLVRLDRDTPQPFRIVIVADGLAGTSLKYLPGFEVDATPTTKRGLGGVTSSPIAAGSKSSHAIPPHTIAMACGRRGYLGAVRLEDGRIDFAAAVDADLLKDAGGLAQAAHALAKEVGVAHTWPLDAVEHWRATPGLTRRRHAVAGLGLFVVGDAAGYVEPFTGEGMAWALAGGHAVAPHAHAALTAGWSPPHAAAWTADFHRRVRRRQLGCRVVAATLRRPRLTRAVVRTLSVMPALAFPFVQKISRPQPARRDAIAAPLSRKARPSVTSGGGGLSTSGGAV